MQVFNTYFKILKKQLVQILIYGIIFVGISIAVTYLFINNEDDLFSTEKVPVLVINNDKGSSIVDGFLEYMKRYVTFEDVKDSDEARSDALFSQKVVYILTIPEGFTKALLAEGNPSLIKQAVPDSVEAASVDTYINNYMNTVKVYLQHDPDITPEQLNSKISLNLSNETKVSFHTKQKKSEIGSNRFNQSYFNYLGYIILSCFVVGVSNVMLSFHGIDIRRRHYITPLSDRKFNFQLISANFIFVLGYLIIFITVGFICNPNHRIDTNTLLNWLNVFLFGITVLSISYLIGITVKSKNAVQALSTIISLSLAFISGIFVPQENLGNAVLKLASFTPTYWFVKANNLIYRLESNNYKNFFEILGLMAVQAGFSAAFISISLVVSKKKRLQEI